MKTMTCDCCGGDLPPQKIWEANRDGADDCDGSVDRHGRCRAFSRDELWDGPPLPKKIKITWVHRDDPKRAAMLGLDEIHDADPDLTDEENWIEAWQSLDYFAEVHGIDTEKYTATIEIIEEEEDQ